MRKMRESVRILLIRRTWWSAAACLCLAAVMFYVVNYPAAIGAAAAARQLPIYCVQRDQKLVSISFDAAWGDVRLRCPKRLWDNRPVYHSGIRACC